MEYRNFNTAFHESGIRARTRGSLARFERAQKALAGGVSSGLRRQSRPYPLYFDRGEGSRVLDVDGNWYLDYGLGWGPLLLGHCPPEIVEAVKRQAERGFTFGAQHNLEIEVAEKLTRIIPCAERVCFANSGTEIVQLALRLARAVTGRRKFIKFEGHYHGWDDSVLVSHHPTEGEIAASGAVPIPAGAGQRQHDTVLVAQWNERQTVEDLFAAHGQEISAIICEPLLCNSGCIPPEPGFLEFLREITLRQGALLIFDEVITGFRIHLAGFQGLYNVTPDLATYAKAVAAGLPLSVLAGRANLMEKIAGGSVVHAGTMNGNPLVLAAASAALDHFSRNNGAIYSEISERGERLRRGLEEILRKNGFAAVTQGIGPVFQLSFMENRPRNYRETLAADKQRYSDFALALLDAGILLLADGRWYISVSHSDAEIGSTLSAVEQIAEAVEPTTGL